MKRAYFIKLGRAGAWEADCIRDGNLRFGYSETPHDLALAGDWAGVTDFWIITRGDIGTAKRDVKQIRTFYEAGDDSVFITFHGGLMYWCRATGPVTILPDGTHQRQTVDGWHSKSLGGVSLTTDKLSGRLLKTQGFRGTICDVEAGDYLFRKLGDQLSPEVAAAEEAEKALQKALVGVLQMLTWQDFETLVDLIFAASGWRRISVLGKTMKTADIEMLLPSTGERAFVQVKSQASDSIIKDYAARLAEAGGYDRMFLVWHTGNVSEALKVSGSILIGPKQLSKMVVEAGLSSWVREKVS